MGKDLIIKVMNHETIDRVPWVPFAGVHAGKLKGFTAKEVLTDGQKLYESLLEVNKLYKPDGMPVVFDLQIEAEILGCDLLWAEDAPPSVNSHPLKDTKEIPCKCKIPEAKQGRIPMVLDVMKKLSAEIGNETALYGLICGPFTLASHLRGNSIFKDMIKDAKYVKELVEFCAEVNIKMAEYYIDAGMDVIAIVDPLVSQVSSKHFHNILADSFESVFSYIRSKGKFSSFFVCGDATNQMEEMCLTKPDNISIDENVDIVKAKETTDKYNIVISGNIPLTTVMLHGNQQDNMKYVVDLLDSITKDNLILSPGCDMPYDVPIENTIGAAMAVINTAETREMVANYQAVEEDIEVDLPDYDHLKKPLVEAFTLDSATCAACTYMWGAAQFAKEHFKDEIDIVEYKYTTKENIARCKKMGVTNLPSLYINGKLKWKSIIPSEDELFEEIKKNMN
ncbi:MAG: uroporphyrinogen decarboxylase [Eubacteriaceae bacterium]|nr:uroporphyrinogen decarboxylase [Eubacteriaceae bacterium]